MARRQESKMSAKELKEVEVKWLSNRPRYDAKASQGNTAISLLLSRSDLKKMAVNLIMCCLYSIWCHSYAPLWCWAFFFFTYYRKAVQQMESSSLKKKFDSNKAGRSGLKEVHFNERGHGASHIVDQLNPVMPQMETIDLSNNSLGWTSIIIHFSFVVIC